MKKSYSFHITFADGSNPYYHFPCDLKHHNAALRKWRKMYTLRETCRQDGIIYYYAIRDAVPTPQLSVYM